MMQYLAPFLFAYAFISLVLPLPCRWYWKVLTLPFLALCASKSQIYNHFGTWLNPNLPVPVIISLEILFAALLIAVFFALIKDVCFLGYSAASWAMHDKLRPWPTSWISLGIALVSLGQAAYGTFSQFSLPEVKVQPVMVKNLPPKLQGTRLVQLSDLHIGPLLKGEFLTKVVARVNELHPDVVLLTGDLVDGAVRDVAPEFAALDKLQATWGVLGVTGNHEYYSGMTAWVDEFERHGVDFLFNEARIFTQDNGSIKIAGVPDRGADVAAALAGPTADFTLLMAHRPRVALDATGADLTIAGHTHGGSMFFLQPIVGHFNDNLVSGMYDLDKRQVYVSNGTGIWSGFSCRFGVPAEITCFVLVPEATTVAP